ncbi:hypothetical protein [Aquimarina celericrescens]|uniref:3-methyladenine DNA glycosylase n=1 Tax=Aquimarina celericrescens TaxID=1964542 RepID=A0ABW5B2H1_9FLAO|nr:hypothetical protein [Aquimarina celericrescens]
MHKKDNIKQEQDSIKENAINIKQKEADGREINHQEKNRREIHQPRDNA